MLRALRTRIDGRPVIAVLVTGNFFPVLGVHAALGRSLTPDDDERAAGRPVIVLSHRGWNTLFAGDPLVIGRSVRINGLPYEIVGVMPDGFRGLGIGPPDYWAPLALAGRFRDDYAGSEAKIPIDVVGRLKPGMSPESATAALTVWASRRTDLETIPGQPASIRLRPRQGTSPDDAGEALLVFSPIFFAFGLVLMIGCANVANLQLARGVSRQREIGIGCRSARHAGASSGSCSPKASSSRSQRRPAALPSRGCCSRVQSTRRRRRCRRSSPIS
jgi:hypothetical protein